MRRHIGRTLAAGALGVLALTACAPTVSSPKGQYGGEAAPNRKAPNQNAPTTGSDGDYGTGTPAPSTAAPTPAAPPVPAAAPNALTVQPLKAMGQIVVDAKGHTLYRFDSDRAEPTPVSNCNAACAQVWVPALTSGTPKLTGIDASLVGTLIRADGGRQITLDGWALYWYTKDPRPGTWTGQGVDNTWWVVAPNGTRNLTCIPKGATPPRNTTPAGG